MYRLRTVFLLATTFAVGAAFIGHASQPPRQVISGFPFHREFDILNQRTILHTGVVDCSVLVESKFTQNGKPKPLYFNESALLSHDLSPSPRIVHIIDEDGNKFKKNDVWAQEVQPRVKIRDGLAACNARANDIIIVSDADEVLDPITIVWLRENLKHGEVASVRLEWNLYNRCWRHAKPTTVSVATTMWTFNNKLEGNPNNIRRRVWDFPVTIVEYPLKPLDKTSVHHREFGGYHCSWCFGPDEFRDKLNSMTPGDPAYSTDKFTKQAWTDERIKRMHSGGTWLDGKAHGKNVCL